MNDIIIYGASDDLIEIGGAINDEFNHYNGPATVTVKVDDAVHLVATAEYDDGGEWRIEIAGNFPFATVSWTKALGEDVAPDRYDADGVPAYSDKLVVHMGAIEPRRINVSHAGAN